MILINEKMQPRIKEIMVFLVEKVRGLIEASTHQEDKTAALLINLWRFSMAILNSPFGKQLKPESFFSSLIALYDYPFFYLLSKGNPSCR